MADTPALRKARGAFYTPSALSRYLVQWAVRTEADRVMEPSCGDAEFLLAAARRLRELGAGDLLSSEQLQGVEVHAPSAALATERLRAVGFSSEIEVADFFDVLPSAKYDVLVGNPPYVRYQQFAGAARKKGLEAALSQGVRLTGLSSSWAPFVVHATRFLAPGGRLGLVLPAELMTVNYAASVRQFLLERFGRVRLVAFHERVFPGVMEEVVLLLAEGSGGARDFEIVHLRNLDALERLEDGGWTRLSGGSEGKWTRSLLEGSAYSAYERVAAEGFSPLSAWGGAYLGGVTGNNGYFTLSARDASVWDLSADELLPISPPGSRHLPALSFGQEDWERLSESEARCFLFYPDRDSPSSAALRYIAHGEESGVPAAYKCRVRTPWWKVPTVRVADLFLTYMSHHGPRLVANEAGVHHLNSLHGVSLHPGLEELGRSLLPLASLNTVTLISAELGGRSYGGGLLKLEPREAGRWMVPSALTLAGCRGALEEILSDARARNDFSDLTAAVDRVLLEDCLGVQPDVLSQLRRAREALLSRRLARAGRSRAAS